MEYRNRWFLIGRNDYKEQIFTYGLDRMLKIESVKKTFLTTKEFDPQTYFKNSFGITTNQLLAQEVVLSFSIFQGKYIKTQPLHDSQIILKDDAKEFRISLNIIISYEFIMQLLSYGKEVKVIKPALLKNKVKAILKEALNNY